MKDQHFLKTNWKNADLYQTISNILDNVAYMPAVTNRLQTHITNSRPGNLRPNKLPFGHRGSLQDWIFACEPGKNISFLWNLNARAGNNLWSPTFPLHQGLGH